MKKIFISVPMNGRTDKAIKRSIKQMHKIAEIMLGEKLEIISSYSDESVPENANEAVWRLGESIKKMSEADYFAGVHYTSMFKGCNIEADVARSYGIKCIYFDVTDCEFLSDAAKKEYTYLNEECIPVCAAIE